ncbi:hypothetical protein [Herminiimonas contaminans]|uniref:Uncharacterized protein n=1 Tax=Herminiimonas contaminans TaxID=1111140 RepID=A0ABS0EQ16_9BURK|nr:hypothetical protein [Herminiimonas contaminans]MBF8176948.1 hypothetical protein [Herminiimonas contaminans]
MSEQKTISDLRAMLFETIAAVKDGTLEIEKAKVISELSQVMVNTAKAEVDNAKATGGVGSGFLESAPVAVPDGALPNGITGITRHVLRG